MRLPAPPLAPIAPEHRPCAADLRGLEVALQAFCVARTRGQHARGERAAVLSGVVVRRCPAGRGGPWGRAGAAAMGRVSLASGVALRDGVSGVGKSPVPGLATAFPTWVFGPEFL